MAHSLTHSRIKKPAMDEYLRLWLVKNLKDDIDRLRQFTGNDFKDWGL